MECKWQEFVVELTHCKMTAEGIIAGNSKLANYDIQKMRGNVQEEKEKSKNSI